MELGLPSAAVALPAVPMLPAASTKNGTTAVPEVVPATGSGIGLVIVVDPPAPPDDPPPVF